LIYMAENSLFAHLLKQASYRTTIPLTVFVTLMISTLDHKQMNAPNLQKLSSPPSLSG
jgi:hypothetical protein